MSKTVTAGTDPCSVSISYSFDDKKKVYVCARFYRVSGTRSYLADTQVCKTGAGPDFCSESSKCLLTAIGNLTLPLAGRDVRVDVQAVQPAVRALCDALWYLTEAGSKPASCEVMWEVETV